MRAIVYSESGDPGVLRMVARPVPVPGPGEVRVRVVVSGVNPTDWKTRQGVVGAPVLPFDDIVPNQDGSGVIDAVGADVDGSSMRFSVGDRVWTALSAYQLAAGGTAQEYTVLPIDRVYPLPDAASFELGASLGVPAITAHRTLTVAQDGPSRLTPGSLAGMTVLVAGGAGAVGHATIQLARWAGATVITTVSSLEKAALAAAAGAHRVVNYRESEAAAHIRSLAPDGVDLIVEVSPATNAELDLAVIRNRGTVAVYANNGGDRMTLDVRRTFSLNIRYQFVMLYTVGQRELDAAADDINAAIESGALAVGADAGLPLHFFDLEHSADAHAAVEAETVGKVLIRVGEV